MTAVGADRETLRPATPDPVSQPGQSGRLILRPVLLRLTGRAAWHCPGWLRRVLPDLRFAHD